MWANKSTEGIVEGVLNDLLRRGGKQRFDHSLELGCGTGHFTELLMGVSSNVDATDPSGPMVEFCREKFRGHASCKIHRASAEEVVTSKLLQHSDLVGAFWSLSYPLQSFFDIVMTPQGRIVQMENNERATAKAIEFLSRLFTRNRERTYLFLCFSSESEEQRWVTRHWERIGPLPGGSRDFTWRLLETFCSSLRNERSTVESETIAGTLTCRDENNLCDVFLRHHLRGLIPADATRDELRSALFRDMANFKGIDGTYQIPAEVHLVKVILNA